MRIDLDRLAARTSATLQQNSADLRYSEEIGDQTFAFRWEDDSFQGKASRPFLQVVLNSKGEIIHYINSLDVLEK